MAVKFTEKAEQVLLAAGNEARERDHEYIGTEHLLFALLRQADSVAVQALQHCDGSPEELEKHLEEALAKVPVRPSPSSIPFTPHAKRTLEIAGDEAVRWGHFFITTEHLLLGLAREEEGVAARLLTELGIRAEQVENHIFSMLGEPKEPSKEQKYQFLQAQQAKLPVLESFSIDLTEQAVLNKLDPVIGREKEIRRLIQILSRKTKNNPVVLGEPGVGKTAIVEGLAHKIANRDVPEVLAQKRVISLDLAAVLAGTKYRGEFEKRIKTIIKEVVDAKNIILFIDELHTMMGAGASESSLDASNILKPPLSRGDIQCIGATTLDEYRKHIEKDSALERRFQPVMVDEPTVDEAVEILFGIRERFEEHHKVKISDEAVHAAVDLSVRYVADRALPDKAIDLIDEAGSRVRLRSSSAPAEIKAAQQALEEVTRQKDEAIAGQDYEAAARLRDEEAQGKEQIEALRAKWHEDQAKEVPVVTDEDIAQVVSMWTGIPVIRISAEESERLLHMEEALHNRVIGQQEAIETISKAVRRARAGLKDPKRPIGSFIFMGPTGTGKTLLARALAEFLFGSEDALIKIDMSEFMERHNVSRLVGAPPGYVGYDEGGQLTEAVRRKSYSVVVLDEIEKAHPEVFNILLQILEDGHLTDAKGRRVDFRNTVIIMTSNVGAQQLQRDTSIGFRAGGSEAAQANAEYDRMKDKVLSELKNTFRPEFLNRIDATVVFRSLTREEIREIVDLLLARVKAQLAGQEMELVVTDAAKDAIIVKGYDQAYGARPLRREIQNQIEDPLAERMLQASFSPGDTIVVDVGPDDTLTIERAAPAKRQPAKAAR